jgi:hypothetical protein
MLTVLIKFKIQNITEFLPMSVALMQKEMTKVVVDFCRCSAKTAECFNSVSLH